MFTSMTQIMQANIRSGGHFFDRATMRFFNSRISADVYGGHYFVTSERFSQAPYRRRYTIRFVADNGDVTTIGQFQAYSCLSTAKRHAQRLGNGEVL